MGHFNTLIFLFFSHSVEDLLVCLGPLSCCTTQFGPSVSGQTDGLKCDSRIFWYTGKFTVDSMTARCPDMTAKQASWYDVFFLTCSIGVFFQTWHCVISKAIAPEVLRFVQLQLCNQRCASMFFLERRVFLLVIFPNESYLLGLFFFYCSKMNFNIKQLRTVESEM